MTEKPTTVPCPHCGCEVNPHSLVGKLTAARMTPEARKARSRRALATKARKKAERVFAPHLDGGQFS